VSSLVHLGIEEVMRHEITVNDQPIYRPVYHLVATVTGGTRVQLLYELEEELHARYIKRAIESYLSLPLA